MRTIYMKTNMQKTRKTKLPGIIETAIVYSICLVFVQFKYVVAIDFTEKLSIFLFVVFRRSLLFTEP